MTQITVFDVAIEDLTRKVCELLGVGCPQEVLEHWNTAEGQEGRELIIQHLRLIGSRALAMGAPPVELSFPRAGQTPVSPSEPLVPSQATLARAFDRKPPDQYQGGLAAFALGSGDGHGGELPPSIPLLWR